MSRTCKYRKCFVLLLAHIELKKMMCHIKKLIYYIKKYPLSLLVVTVVVYLSFFRPPSDTGLGDIPHLDKVVHFCMYFGMVGILWFEFLRNHFMQHAPMWHAWVGGMLFPILFGGVVELLQEYCTNHRGGDWLDFAANTTGAVVGSLVAYYILRPNMGKILAWCKKNRKKI